MFSLSLIGRPQEHAWLDRLMQSTKNQFDEVVIVANDGEPEDVVKEFELVCKKWGIKYFYEPWKDDFAATRNSSLAKCTGEYVMWADMDDVIIGAENLPEMLKIFDEHVDCGAVWMWYDYSHDEHGNVTSQLRRERIVRRASYEWVGELHELLCPKEGQMNYQEPTDMVRVKHLATDKDLEKGVHRNLRICERLYKEFHDKECQKPKDVRILHHYARALYTVGKTKESYDMFVEFINQGECHDERWSAMDRVCKIDIDNKNYVSALNWAHEMLKARPDQPQGLFNLARIYWMMERYDECIAYTKMGLSIEPDYTGYVPYNPMEYKLNPLVPFFHSHVAKSKFKEAATIAKKALSIVPDNAFWNGALKTAIQYGEQNKHMQDSIDHVKYIAENEPGKLLAALKSVHKELEHHPRVVRELNKFRKVERAKRLVIFCGPTVETWGPSSVETGIGGSEEMVINLAPELQRLGWNVEVFNSCVSPFVHEGVKWAPYDMYDPHLPAEITIIWRRPDYVQFIKDKDTKVYLWAHDVQKKEWYNKLILDRIHKIIVLSKHQRGYLPDVPEDKFLYSRNGIIPEHFNASAPRDKKACVYASAPDRGLLMLLRMWPSIKKEVPEATLHTFYGFNRVYLDMMKNDVHRDYHYKEIMKMYHEYDMKGIGVADHGMVGHKELAKCFKGYGLWLYPTWFEEISCITAMKAQAAGAVPICTSLAALDETVQYGDKSFPGDMANHEEEINRYIDRVVSALKDEAWQDDVRPDMMAWANKHFAMSTLAKEWNEEFKK